MNAKWILLTLITPYLLAGCQGALWGNIIVLGITFGVFFGTLSLGRTSEESSSTSTASVSREAAPRS